MISHLKVHHPKQHNELKRDSPCIPAKSLDKSSTQSTQKQLTLQESFNKKAQWSPSSPEYKAVTMEITKMLCKDGLPLYTVEKPGFKAFIHFAFQGKYKIPDRKHFSHNSSEKLYRETKESVQEKLKSAVYYSATTDLWSSVTSVPFISLTVNFTDNEWNMKNYMLETLYMPQDHTGDNIAQVIEQCLEEWNLDKNKLAAMTTDSGSNVKLAMTNMNVTRMACFGHILHNGINFGLDSDADVEPTLKKARKIASVFSYSWKKRRELTKIQTELGLPVRAIAADCKTRWGSKLKLIQRILEQEKALRIVLSDRNHVELIPTAYDFLVS